MIKENTPTINSVDTDQWKHTVVMTKKITSFANLVQGRVHKNQEKYVFLANEGDTGRGSEGSPFLLIRSRVINGILRLHCRVYWDFLCYICISVILVFVFVFIVLHNSRFVVGRCDELHRETSCLILNEPQLRAQPSFLSHGMSLISHNIHLFVCLIKNWFVWLK